MIMQSLNCRAPNYVNMAKLYNLLLLSVVLLSVVNSQAPGEPHKRDQFRVHYEWTTFNFSWPSDTVRRDAIASSKYIKENVIISGMKHYGDKLFVTLPRFKDGVPATLAYIPQAPLMNDTSPLLVPFPTWELNEIGNCNAFQSVQSMEVDRSGIMWVLDTGRTSTLKSSNVSSNVTCSPSLTLIDLNDNKNSILVRYNFPSPVASNRSYLCDIVVDDAAGGYAYITDNNLDDPGIIVFSRKDSRSWKLRERNTMTAAPNAFRVVVNGSDHEIRINVDGIALGPRYALGGKIERDIFYSPMSSYKLYSMPTSLLKNESLAIQPDRVIIQSVRELGVKPSQTDGMIMDNEGNLYYGLIANHSIMRWNSATGFDKGQHWIAKDPNYIQWVDRFTFDDSGNIYVVINRLHNFVFGAVNPAETNYRILRSHTGTKSYIHGLTEEQFNKNMNDMKPKAPVDHPAHSTVNKPGASSSKPTSHSYRSTGDVSVVLLSLACAYLFSVKC